MSQQEYGKLDGVASLSNNGTYPQKDPDAVKLFIGQIPRTYEEQDIKEVFARFGPIYEVSIIRDRNTRAHKGCCFLTFCARDSAVKAEEALHAKHTLPGMTTALQVRPANQGKEEERKLFVGMLPKTFSDAELKALVSRYGVVEEATVLRDKDGLSKGCAFVRMQTKNDAEKCITQLHNCMTLPGCNGAIQVKIADTDGEKQQKRLLNSLTTMAPLPALQAYQQLLKQQMQQQLGMATQFQAGSVLGSAIESALSQTQQLQQMQQMQQYGMMPGQTATTAAAAAYSPAQMMGGAQLMQQPTQSTTSLSTTPTASGLTPESILQAYSGVQAVNQMIPATMQQRTTFQRPREGPDGCNLFIYHLPQNMSDADLIQLFSTYGEVISATVFIDKQTNLSKCFGFVSYNNPQSAQNALLQMNGYQVDQKRLKVSLKKPKGSKPY
ncbi:CUGBP Elav-like family member 3-B isoform X2 [Dysidea avara]|uniref:CUGBP Elav-like family member 3-B isoform X2 n=1 Tax=Dysidea avara TaxID=196820 RepID=UPI00332CAD44